MTGFLNSKKSLVASALIMMNAAFIGNAQAHCDSMDGPVIIEAKSALEKRDVTPLLKWVPQADEPQLKKAFAQTLKERAATKASPEAVDRKFFALLVRVHRKSEGAPFTGIKPAGQIEPIVAVADKSLSDQNPDQMLKHVLGKLEQSIREKFSSALESRKHADESVEKGREFVSHYVQYVHFLEALDKMAEHQAEH